NPPRASPQCCLPRLCKLLHTVSKTQTCSSGDLFGGGPPRAKCTETADNWCSRPFIELGGYSLTHRLEVHFKGKPGCAAPGSGPRAHLDSERSSHFVCLQWLGSVSPALMALRVHNGFSRTVSPRCERDGGG